MRRVFFPQMSIAAVGFILASCAGLQSHNLAPVGGLLANLPATASEGSNGLPLRGARDGDLLYVLTGTYVNIKLRTFSFPGGKPRGTIGGAALYHADAICSDASGNVWVVINAPGGGRAVEFAHGGSRPIAVLSDPTNAHPNGCAVDPKTGNLAITSYGDSGITGNIAVYIDSRGSPTIYTDPDIASFASCAYDGDGNLLAAGETRAPIPFAMLAYGHSTFLRLKVKRSFNPGSAVQWDGANWAVLDNGTNSIYRMTVSGSRGLINGKTELRSDAAYWIWLQGSLVGASNTNNVKLFRYPNGGKAIRTVLRGAGSPLPLAVSVAPK